MYQCSPNYNNINNKKRFGYNKKIVIFAQQFYTISIYFLMFLNYVLMKCLNK